MSQSVIECLELNLAGMTMTKIKDSHATNSKSQLEIKLNS